MRPATSSRVLPYRFDHLTSMRHEEVLLWNFYCRVGPSHVEWTTWAKEIFGHVLERPEGSEVRLVQTHLVDEKFGEKTLTFGSKQELSIGRELDNDVVLAANAIANRHARVLMKDGRAYVQDLGSRLGTYLWDKRVGANELQAVTTGDQFTVFPYRFRVQLEPRWSAESNVKLSESTVQPTSRAEFARNSPAGWRAFVVNAHPTGDRALLQANPSFLARMQERMLAPLRIDSAGDRVPSDDSLFIFVVIAVFERLNRALKFPVQLSVSRTTRDGLPDATRGMLLSFAISVGGLSGQFRVFLPFAFLTSCMADAVSADAAVYPSALGWRLPVSMGYVDLFQDEIAQVGPGDILVTQRSGAALFPNNFSKGWTLIPDESNSTVFKVDKYFERSMPVELGGEALADSLRPDIQALPLRLHVVLGEKDFTLAQLQSLSPGTIVELEVAKSDPVRLMVNGKILGEGELVDVDGNLAVKVLRWRTG